MSSFSELYWSFDKIKIKWLLLWNRQHLISFLLQILSKFHSWNDISSVIPKFPVFPQVIVSLKSFNAFFMIFIGLFWIFWMAFQIIKTKTQVNFSKCLTIKLYVKKNLNLWKSCKISSNRAKKLRFQIRQNKNPNFLSNLNKIFLFH